MQTLSLETTIAAELPGAAELFRRSAINFCCSGDIPLREAAERTGLSPADLLAEKVERVHGDHPVAPSGLARALVALKAELEDHMTNEEQILFPLMRQGQNTRISHPIAQMRHEHADTVRLLQDIEHAAHGMALPEGACGSWTALYTGLRKLTDDRVLHMHLENAVLFPRFETPEAAIGA